MKIIPCMIELFIGSKLKKLATDEDNLIQQSPEIVKQKQVEKLNNLLSHFKQFDFYNKLLHTSGCSELKINNIEQINRLPIITKDFIIQNFDIISIQPEVAFITSTSGSTGYNFKFCHCKNTQAHQRMALILSYQWMGIDFFKDKKLAVWGRHPGTKWKTELIEYFKTFVKNGKTIDAYGMNEEKALKILENIYKFKPKLLTAYPNYAYDLALVGLKHHMPCPATLRAIVLSGEMVYDFQVQKIEEFFKCKAYRRYGSREFGTIAHECPVGGSLHIFPGRFFIETDSNGELLVTDLDNFATPFIRYRIGDMGKVVSLQCKCGFRHQSILDIQGRSHDIIKTKSGKMIGGQFWTTLSRSVPGIRQFQVVQKDDKKIDFNIIISDDYLDNEEYKLHNELKKIVGDELSMNINKVDNIIPLASGKHKYIIKL